MKKSRTVGKTRSDASTSKNNNRRGETFVDDYGTYRGSCGYCNSPSRTSISHGLWAYSVTVDDYQDLLDRGWRRSGSFLYKPDMQKTCCPSYTIRLKANDFVPSKEQRRVSRRMQKFLDGKLNAKTLVGFTEDPSTSNCHKVSSSVEKKSLSHDNEEKNREEQILLYLSDQIDNAVKMCTVSEKFPFVNELPKSTVKKVSQAKKSLLVEGTENLLYSSNIAFQIAAILRRAELAEKDVQQLRVMRQNTENNGLSSKIIAEKLASSLNQLVESSGLSVKACNGHLNFYSAAKQVSSNEDVQIVTVSKESTTECENKGSCLKNTSENPQGERHKLRMRLKRSSFDRLEFELYRRYQIKVHNDKPDEVTETSYRRFLVDTPLVFVQPSGDGTVPPCGFGSFHQQYLIDDRLVAVGVIDILPRCLSSKYLFWDPDFAFLSLGKYSALQEIGWVKENQAYCSTLQNYYLGYYIHSCRKMRYKAAYRPSELLCPLRYQWVPYDVARPLLDRRAYAVLSDFASSEIERLQPCDTENVMALQDGDIGQNLNDVLVDYDKEMLMPESEGDDDKSVTEANGLTVAIQTGDIGNILIGVKGTRARYKDIQRTLGCMQRRTLESQLRRYLRVVGAELSERMVYSLG